MRLLRFWPFAAEKRCALARLRFSCEQLIKLLIAFRTSKPSLESERQQLWHARAQLDFSSVHLHHLSSTACPSLFDVLIG